ncbi:hypothetical protein [Agrobacterium sp. ICMP 6402]|uniref:hypothetical protein n=1 Tax=Agrobacterium sp. ICMP 6402 TaxID=2292443 RepID=UPI0018864451|nr:hypothetical protein [Agrobacterium sp. ICMP 6402]
MNGEAKSPCQKPEKEEEMHQPIEKISYFTSKYATKKKERKAKTISTSASFTKSMMMSASGSN